VRTTVTTKDIEADAEEGEEVAEDHDMEVEAEVEEGAKLGRNSPPTSSEHCNLRHYKIIEKKSQTTLATMLTHHYQHGPTN